MKAFLWVILAGWMMVSILLHLAPPPGTWGDWAIPLRKMYAENHAGIQATAHATLMGGFAFILMHLLRSDSLFMRLVIVLSLTMLFAAGMEWMQAILPAEFRRECDPYDLLPALAGAVVGGILGWLILRRKRVITAE